MKVYLATDHVGLQLKETLKQFLMESGYEVEDCGAAAFNPSDDYPDFIGKAAERLSCDLSRRDDAVAIVLGGSGQGEAMVANKFKGVRAAVYYGGSKDIVALSREHNDANVLALGARFLAPEEAKEAVALWLKTPFSNEGRHKRRIEKIARIEKQP